MLWWRGREKSDKFGWEGIPLIRRIGIERSIGRDEEFESLDRPFFLYVVMAGPIEVVPSGGERFPPGA